MDVLLEIKSYLYPDVVNICYEYVCDFKGEIEALQNEMEHLKQRLLWTTKEQAIRKLQTIKSTSTALECAETIWLVGAYLKMAKSEELLHRYACGDDYATLYMVRDHGNGVLYIHYAVHGKSGRFCYNAQDMALVVNPEFLHEIIQDLRQKHFSNL